MPVASPVRGSSAPEKVTKPLVVSSPHLLSTWSTDLLLPVASPTRIYIRSACHGVIALSELDPGLTIGGLKHLIYERLMLRPSQDIRLISWGRELADQYPLSDYALQTNARLEMQLGLRHAPERVLSRIRIASTAIKTRQCPAETTLSVLDLKKRIEQLLLKGDHEWYDPEGGCKRMRGCTLLVTAAMKADEKAGTSAGRLGDELVYEGNFDGTKKAAISVRKADSGRTLTYMDSSLVL